ncbi:hypothetical protein CASFOL_029283 [Castilleja foliolosa]|uniref:Uncharacterized protein n=1 Tax=Castilleja foliolosa TaxID=1961234 RepID=A0ABD3CAK5_9LAMI
MKPFTVFLCTPIYAYPSDVSVSPSPTVVASYPPLHAAFIPFRITRM